MGKRSLIIFAGVLIGVLVLGAGALYAYDHGRRDKIAKGVKVAGIDVGGLNAAQARARLSREYLPRFEHPVVVRFHAHRFKLSSRAAQVTVDVNGAVDEALQRSRDGSIFTRVAPKKRCNRLESCAETAWLSRLPPAATKLDELPETCAAARPGFPEGSRPTASSAMISEVCSGGSEL